MRVHSRSGEGCRAGCRGGARCERLAQRRGASSLARRRIAGSLDGAQERGIDEPAAALCGEPRRGDGDQEQRRGRHLRARILVQRGELAVGPEPRQPRRVVVGLLLQALGGGLRRRQVRPDGGADDQPDPAAHRLEAAIDLGHEDFVTTGGGGGGGGAGAAGAGAGGGVAAGALGAADAGAGAEEGAGACAAGAPAGTATAAAPWAGVPDVLPPVVLALATRAGAVMTTTRRRTIRRITTRRAGTGAAFAVVPSTGLVAGTHLLREQHERDGERRERRDDDHDRRGPAARGSGLARPWGGPGDRPSGRPRAPRRGPRGPRC